MAWPYIFSSNFEAGTNAEWDSETDTGSKLDIAHYTSLAKFAGMPAPFRGAYCARIVLGDTNDHTLTAGAIDIADAGTGYFRWYQYVSPDFTATADDVFSILELQQAGGTVEQTVGMRITASSNLLEIGVGDGTAPSSYVTFPRGRWVCVELLSTISTGGSGAMTLYLDGGSAIALTGQTQAAAVGQGVLGTQLTLATTTGTILFDQFVFDDTRVYPIKDRFPDQMLLLKSTHVFVGEGTIENVTLLPGAGTDNVVTIYDTDRADTTDVNTTALVLHNLTASEPPIDPAGVPVVLKRGAYITLAGTNPRAMVKIGRARGYHSDANIKSLGASL